MKEATGELSMTAVVVVVIGILAVSLPIIIRGVIKTAKHNANCSAAYGCGACNTQTKLKSCYYYDDEAQGENKEISISCACSSEELSN